MTAPSDHRTSLSVGGLALSAAANALFLLWIALGIATGGVLLCVLLAINAGQFAHIAYVVRAHSQARQPVSTDQAGEGV